MWALALELDLDKNPSHTRSLALALCLNISCNRLKRTSAGVPRFSTLDLGFKPRLDFFRKITAPIYHY